MIFKAPTPGDSTDELMWPYDDRVEVSPMLHDTPPVRVSLVLGPDGEPVMVDMPRRKIGFDLRKREQ